jgi:hypothetical protein
MSIILSRPLADILRRKKIEMRKLIYASMIVLMCVTTFAPRSTASAAPSNSDPVNLLLNGGFEEGNYSPTGTPDNWTKESYDSSPVMLWDDTQSFEGNRSVKITLTTHNDARWMQTVNVQPNTNYLVSGWIKTDYDSGSIQRVDLDAFLFLLEYPVHHSQPLFSTNDWTYVSFAFNSGEQTQFTVAARLGGWGETTTGTAWFDDLQMTPIQATDPHPGWKILLLIYDTLDFTVTDSSGVTHRYYSEMTQEEKDQTEQIVTQFVAEDIPALSSGNMIPAVTIRHPERALTKLSRAGEGWSPDPWDVTADRDPAYDSVIVVWDPVVVDQTTGETTWIGAAAGLAYWTGTEQTYTAIIIDAVTTYGHRNVLKHEWGHTILFFYEAFGTAPKPAVDNHAFGTPETQYVHCPTGEPYILVDETLDNPIPNSIYNNESGFTHDYYSGTTAVQDQPTRCLGITPEAWASGGPVSRPVRSFTSIEKLQLIKNDVTRLVRESDLAESRAKLLYAKLDAARAGLREERSKATIKNLELFINKVQGLVKTGRLAAEEGVILIDQATTLINELKG